MGSNRPCLDEIYMESRGQLHIGCFGGSSARGASKKEDALLVLKCEEKQWTFAVILDAHHTAQSAKMMIDLI
ncbi:hypothetical protein [Marinicrinis lubricantis]|uniref:Uncharacterized protein n=1 Tax=Marinicrinis lubricantis TaxID=2086470 RepID=A0ABW1IPB8_9BACL